MAMRLRRAIRALDPSLPLLPARSPLYPQCAHCRRRYASSTSAGPGPDRIAILGGGISGLASAHFAAKQFPKSKITVFESQKELGGWIKSRRVGLKGRWKGSVLFEHGPRTLRPGVMAAPTVQLVCPSTINRTAEYTVLSSEF
jgi:oxygen-dependent protoporphyrinogen oxidase